MANRSSFGGIDLQELVTEAAKLELKALHAGVECWQVWINQVAKFSNIANDTLQAIEEDKASASDAARRFTKFGKENAEVLTALSSRLSKSYFEEIDRLTATIEPKENKRAAPRKAASKSKAKAAVKRVARKSSRKKVARPAA